MSAPLVTPPAFPTTPASPAGRPRPSRAASARALLVESSAPPPHVGHPLLAFSATMAAGSIVHATGAEPWWLLAAGGAGAVVAGVVTHHRFTAAGPEVTFSAVSSAALGGWLAWAAHTTPWSGESIGSLALGTVVLGPLYGLLRWRRGRVGRREVEVRAAVRAEAKRHMWDDILIKAGVKDVHVVEDVAFRAGFMLRLHLGADAPDSKGLAVMTSDIERVAASVTGLPIRSGSIQVDPGQYANEATLIVPTRDVLAEMIPFPDLHGPRSINDPMVTGQYLDGSEVEVTFRGFHGMFAGMTNFGKSGLLNTHMAQTTRCVDNVTMVCAGNKSVRWLRPWLLPWLRGYAKVPPIDWVAPDIDEALAQLLDIYRAIDGRQAMPNNGKDGWEPSAENPQITIYVDESTDLLESTKTVTTHKGEKVTFADLLLIIVRTARSEAIQVIFCSQRGTATLLGGSGGDLKSQVLYRVGFKALGNMTDVNAVFNTHTTGIDLSTLPKGAWFVELDGFERPRLAKGYWLESERIEQYAIEATQYVGGVDPATAALMKSYAGRWSRPGQLKFLEAVNGGPLRQELVDMLTQPTAKGAPGNAMAAFEQWVKDHHAGEDITQELFEQFIRETWQAATPDERAAFRASLGAEAAPAPVEPATGDYDASDAIARIKAWADRKATDQDDLAVIEAAWAMDPVDEPDPSTAAGGSPTADTLALLAVIAASGALSTGEEWLPAADVRAMAAKHLGWPDNPEGDRRVTEALGAVRIQSTRKGKKKITAYPVAALRTAIQRHHDDGGTQ